VNIVTIQLQESAEAPRLFQRMDFDTLKVFDLSLVRKAQSKT
jgi:hypothetical protein